jgi:hypothetical protein
MLVMGVNHGLIGLDEVFVPSLLRSHQNKQIGFLKCIVSNRKENSNSNSRLWAVECVVSVEDGVQRPCVVDVWTGDHPACLNDDYRNPD